MEEAIRTMKDHLAKLAGAVQDLQADTQANVVDLSKMARRMAHMDETLSTLGGTVAGVGGTLETLFDSWRDHESRIQALEGKKSA